METLNYFVGINQSKNRFIVIIKNQGEKFLREHKFLTTQYYNLFSAFCKVIEYSDFCCKI